MIFGYVSKNRYPEIEESLKRNNLGANVFEFSIGDKRAFFFQYSQHKLNRLTYHDANRLLLCDGIPIRRGTGGSHEIIDTLSKDDIQRGFAHLIDNIVSNVSMLFFEEKDCAAEVILSSARAAPGKMWYRSIPSGIAFSSDFTSLLKFSPFNLNGKAVYSIIRYGACPPPMTISTDIRAVPMAHYSVFNATGKMLQSAPYFHFDFPQTRGFDISATDSLLDLSSEVLDRLRCSLLVSGGVDSTLFAHKVRQHSHRRLNAYYLCFGHKDPELPFAKEAARKAGCSLTIFSMGSHAVRDTILEVASSYTHPFNDYSVIPTYYVMKCASNCENEGIVVDSTGGDECFGYWPLDPSLRWKENILFSLPALVKEAVSSIYSHSNLWKKEGGIRRLFSAAAKFYLLKQINLAPLVSCPWTGIFEANTKEYDTEIGALIVNSFTDLLEPLPHNESYNARATVALINHVSAGIWGAKSHGIKSLPGIQVVYPYLWKDILEEQGKLSWRAKVSNGVIKWPEKKLLETYMSHDFIYRRKSGFTPPFENWFTNKKVYELLHDTLLGKDMAIESVINREKLRELIYKLPHTKQWSEYLCNFLWGTLFTELWIEKNVKSGVALQGNPDNQL